MGNRISAEMVVLRRSLVFGGQSGFSLLELLLVCALVGIMAALALPRLGEVIFADPLAGSATRIVGLVGGARATAVRTGKPQLLSIDIGNGRLWFEEDAPATEKRRARATVVQLPEEVRLRAVVIAGKTSSGAVPVKLWISRQGMLHPVLLDLADRDGRSLRLTVHPLFPKVDVLPLAADAAAGESPLLFAPQRPS